VHLRDPGKVEREDWLTGTQAAAAGGITTILEMPLAIPPVHSAAILKERAAHVGPRSIVDFALYAGANGDILDEIEPMASAGAIAFKTFRTRPPKGREPEFVGITCPDAGQMLLTMQRTAPTGLLHVVHAEDQQILDVTDAGAPPPAGTTAACTRCRARKWSNRLGGAVYCAGGATGADCRSRT
jgi:dihydropyrimidinase/allantoinase